MKKLLVLLVLSALSLVPAQAQSGAKWVRVENHRAAFPIWSLYISPSNSDSWGSDQLGGQVISAGYSRTFTIPWEGCYVDVKVVTFTGLETERRQINVCGGFEWKIYD